MSVSPPAITTYLADGLRPARKEKHMESSGQRGRRRWWARAAALFCALALQGMYIPAQAAEIMGIDQDGGGIFQTYTVNGVPLLDSFYFRFTGGDHNVQAVAAQPASPVPDPCFDCSGVPAGKIFLTLQ